MKSFKVIFSLLVLMAFFTVSAMASDLMITGKISTVTQKVTKNGEAYVIIAVPEQKSLNGVAYTTDTSVFCFKNEAAKQLKPGQDVKLIAKKTSKDGNEFVTLIQFIK